MALNTGGFNLSVMPQINPGAVAAMGVGDYNAVTEAGQRALGDPTENLTIVPRWKTTQANQRTAESQSVIAKAKADVAPELARNELKSAVLANQLSEGTLQSKIRLAAANAGLAEAELKFKNETDPTKAAMLGTQLEGLRTQVNQAKTEYNANLENDLYNIQARQKATMANAGAKALTGFDETGTRTIKGPTGNPLAVQTLTPTAEGAQVSSVALPQTQVVGVEEESLGVDPKTGLEKISRFERLSSGGRGKVIGDRYVGEQIDTKSSTIRSPGAAQLGLPEEGPNIAAGLDVDTAKRVLTNSMITAGKELDKDANALETRQAALNQLNEFQQLNAETDTGPIISKVPGTVTFSENRQRMKSISDALTPTMRGGLPGAASDKDVAMFKSATVSIDKDKETNDAIIDAYKAQTARDADFLQFRQDYLQRYKTLNGANAAWSKYVNANPIFDPNSKEPKLNTDIQTRQEFFSGKSEDAAESETITKSSAGGLPSITTEAEYAKLKPGAKFIWNGQTLIK